MSGKYVSLICKKCNHSYIYWPDKGLFASHSYCPDCNISRKSEAIYGLPLENIPDKKPGIDKIWADNQKVDLLVKLAGLTRKQKEAVNQFRQTGTIPKDKSTYYQAVKKMAAQKAKLRG